MPDVIHELYAKQIYPPKSHPLSEPAVFAVAATQSGIANFAFVAGDLREFEPTNGSFDFIMDHRFFS